jgi:hypothetical protein
MVGLKINTFDPKPVCAGAAAVFADAVVAVAQATAIRVPATKIARNMRMLISLLQFSLSAAVQSIPRVAAYLIASPPRCST